MSTADPLPPVDDSICDLAPSCKLVLQALLDGPTATRADLVEETWLKTRTVRWALNRLQDEGLVDVQPGLYGDARWKYYSPTPKARQAVAPAD